MYTNADIFKIETNKSIPAQGKVLISEPFLCDYMFGRAVILLIDHTESGSMGLVLNKPLPLFLNQIMNGFDYPEDIPIYKGGPLSTDTLFYLHTLKDIPGSLPVANNFYLNGDFNAIRQYMRQGMQIKGKIRFFLGYSGWAYEQLRQEISENTWLIGEEEVTSLMNDNATTELWKHALKKLGGKYEMWSRFPQIPTLN